MPSATGQRIVFEYELPSGPFSHMMISARKYADRDFVFADTGTYALYQAINGGVYIEIGGKSDEARENTVETHLTNLPIIATAEVTITGSKWRIEVTEAPPTASMVGVDPRHDMDYVSELPLHFSITVHHYGGDTRAGTFVIRELRGSVADPSADDGDGGALTNVDAGDEPDGSTPPPPPEEESGDDLDGLIPPEGEGGALTNVDAGDEEEAQPETWLEQQLRLANTPVESGGANDGGRARRQVELNEGELGHVDAGELDGLTLPEDAGGAHSGRYGLYWNPGDGGRFQLRFDDDATGALTPAATAAAIDAALEALNGITVAEVTGEPGDWTLTITADEGHILQAVDVVEGVFFDGDLQLDYLGA